MCLGQLSTCNAVEQSMHRPYASVSPIGSVWPSRQEMHFRNLKQQLFVCIQFLLNCYVTPQALFSLKILQPSQLLSQICIFNRGEVFVLFT